MPILDVSLLLGDPDFSTTFTVNRNTQTVDTHGVASNAVTVYSNVVGVVQPMGGATLMRRPDGELVTGDIQIFTTFRLSQGLGGVDADVVTWAGRNWTVYSVDDWSQWGAGYVRAIAKLKEFNS